VTRHAAPGGNARIVDGMTEISRKPFLPHDEDALRIERRSWHRGIAARALATLRNDDPARIAKTAWPNDARAQLITRGAVSPTSTANFPANDVVSAFRSIAPGSAALALFDLALKIDMQGVSTVAVPNVASLPPAPVFVAEGAPGPAVQWTFGKAVLGPVRKILILSAVSGELNDATPETASAAIGRVLADSANKSIDTVAFDNNVADTVRPAGLLHGVTPLAAAAAGSEAMFDDLGALTGAIGAAGVDPTDAAFVASPCEATIMRAKCGLRFTNPILPTLRLPAKTVACFAPAAVASGYQDAPVIETGRESVIHFENKTLLTAAAHWRHRARARFRPTSSRSASAPMRHGR
jgi:hypothetical protein